MKSMILAAAVGTVLAAASSASIAACAAPSVRVNTIASLTTLLQGNTVCVGSAGAFDWQEEHVAGGALFDYKRGPSHPVDPREQVGTWMINGTDGRSVFVVHTYGASSYTYSVWNNGDGTHSFCSAATAEIRSRVKSGGGGCP